MKKISLVVVVALLAFALVAGLWWREQTAALSVRLLIAQKLDVASDRVTFEKLPLNDLGDYCVFFRIDNVTPKTRQIIDDRLKYFDRTSQNQLTAYLPLNTYPSSTAKSFGWWTLRDNRAGCNEWVANWDGRFRVNIVICGDVLYGYLENTFERKATSGPF